MDWSPDGRFLLHTEQSPDGTRPLVASEVTENGRTIAIVPGGTITDEARFSPDGKWIAYNSNETGRHEVFLVPFKAQAQRIRVSNNGAVQPRWRADGRELYYLDLEGRMNAVTLTYDNATVVVGNSHVLFTTALEPTPFVEQYANTGDGQRFLIKAPIDDATWRSISVIFHWQQLLERGKVGRQH
jgi:hypothetical protein